MKCPNVIRKQRQVPHDLLNIVILKEELELVNVVLSLQLTKESNLKHKT